MARNASTPRNRQPRCFTLDPEASAEINRRAAETGETFSRIVDRAILEASRPSPDPSEDAPPRKRRTA